LTGALLGALILAVGGYTVSSSAASPHARNAVTPAVGFSHAVVVDQQRPGFEPDVKVDGKGNVYTSVPFGFSTTQSFVWSSRDQGNSYQLTPGNIGPGKPTTCVGGGDTDLFLDSADALYFSDLQGLTNISNSMSTDGGATWSTNCAGAPIRPMTACGSPAPAARPPATSSSIRTTTPPTLRPAAATSSSRRSPPTAPTSSPWSIPICRR
jgi:hypothetical protein